MSLTSTLVFFNRWKEIFSQIYLLLEAGRSEGKRDIQERKVSKKHQNMLKKQPWFKCTSNLLKLFQQKVTWKMLRLKYFEVVVSCSSSRNLNTRSPVCRTRKMACWLRLIMPVISTTIGTKMYVSFREPLFAVRFRKLQIPGR